MEGVRVIKGVREGVNIHSRDGITIALSISLVILTSPILIIDLFLFIYVLIIMYETYIYEYY